jgi:hypothetical protein
MRRIKRLTIIAALFVVQPAALALGPYKPILPSGGVSSARRTKRLLATVQVSPSTFTYDGKQISFREAWIQHTKYDNRILLCFRLSGFRKKHLLGDEPDDLYFGASGQYFGQYWNWFDGHSVHGLDITSDAHELPPTMQISFYGSAQKIGYALKKAPALEVFDFKIQKSDSSKPQN